MTESDLGSAANDDRKAALSSLAADLAADSPPASGDHTDGGTDESRDSHPETGVGWLQENVEAVVVAVVLAVIIRHFAMEAFVIPTGSMAPTLYGLHAETHCPNCAFGFAVAFPEPDSSGSWPDFQTVGRPAWRVNVMCDGCNSSRRIILPQEDFLDGTAKVTCTADGCDSTTRVNLSHPATAPQPATLLWPDCPQCEHSYEFGIVPPEVKGGNKILVNKFVYKFRDPRRFEVMVFKNPNDPSKTFIKRVMGLPGEQIQIRDGDVYIDEELFRKPPRVQETMLQPVYEMHYVEALEGRKPPWKAFDSSWTLDFHSLEAGDVGDRESWVEFTREIRDTYGYNSRDEFSRGSGDNVVGDLMVSLDVTRQGSTGGVFLSLREDDDDFSVFLRGDDPGELRPSALRLGGRALTGCTDPNLQLKPGVTYQLTFENIDNQIRLLVDGREMFAYTATSDPDKWTTRRSGVRLGIRGAATRFDKIRIDRDLYYTSSGSSRSDFTLGTDEFLVLGDNSPSSQDSRKWSQPGVPRPYIVGRAFAVFWPLLDFKMIR